MKKILLIRFSSIGDIVLTTPIVRAIKQQSDYELHVLTKKQYSGIYEANPNVEKVHSFKKNISECLGELKSEKFDVIVDLQKSMRSHNVKKQLKVQSYTFPKVNIEKWLLVNFKINRLPDIHIVDRYLKAVEHLGIKNDNLGLEYYIPIDDEVIPVKINDNLKNGYIGFVIGGQHSTKILPSEKAVQIISNIEKPVVLLGGPDDKQRGDDLVKMLPNSIVINTCGFFNINQSASLVRQADVIITNDTGLMHIAAAFNKPTISIWGNTVPAFGMYPYMPKNSNNFTIAEVANLSCRPCSKIGYNKCPKKHFKCMLDQDVEAIVGAVDRFSTNMA
ncbi:MAG: glycosyltransferase family 9 protein [Bacteroidota bacterium]